MIRRESSQKVLQPDPGHELSHEFRAVLFGKLRPEVGIPQNDVVCLVRQSIVAKVKVHLGVGPCVDARVDDFHFHFAACLVLQQALQQAGIRFPLRQAPAKRP